MRGGKGRKVKEKIFPPVVADLQQQGGGKGGVQRGACGCVRASTAPNRKGGIPSLLSKLARAHRGEVGSWRGREMEWGHGRWSCA
jgi:hypothetical protein